MTQKQESKHIKYSDVNNLYGYTMSKFLLINGFKWIDPKVFDSNKYGNNSSTGCVSEVDFEYPKELCRLHNDYPLAPDKIEINREVLSNCQIQVDDFYSVLISTIKKMVPNFLNKKKYVLLSENLQLYLKLELKLKNTSYIRIQSNTMVKTICQI